MIMLFGQTTKIRFYDFSVLLKYNKFLKCINFSLSYLLFVYIPALMLLLSHLWFHKFKYSFQRSMWVEGIRNFLTQKVTQEKSATFTKILSYTNFSCKIFFVEMSRYFYYIYCLQEQSTHFGLKVSIHFDLVSRQFDTENRKQNIDNIDIDFLNYTNFSWTISMPNCSEILILHTVHKPLTTWLTQFCVIAHPNLFIFDLAHTTRIHSNLRFDLNCKNW